MYVPGEGEQVADVLLADGRRPRPAHGLTTHAAATTRCSWLRTVVRRHVYFPYALVQVVVWRVPLAVAVTAATAATVIFATVTVAVTAVPVPALVSRSAPDVLLLPWPRSLPWSPRRIVRIVMVHRRPIHHIFPHYRLAVMAWSTTAAVAMVLLLLLLDRGRQTTAIFATNAIPLTVTTATTAAVTTTR